MRNESIRYLIVPGWQGSPDNHWQSHWQRSLPNSVRVEQRDWLTPQRRDWVQALEQAIAAERSPVILIAHSLGCITVAHWAAQAARPAAPSARRIAGGSGGCRASHLLARAAQFRTDPAAAAAIPESGGQFGQRPGRQCAACIARHGPGAPRRGCWPMPGISTSSPAMSAGSKVLPTSIACKAVSNSGPCAAPDPRTVHVHQDARPAAASGGSAS